MTKQMQDAVLRQSIPNFGGVSVDASRVVRELDKALRILRMKQLIERTGLSRATLYVLMSTDPTFPRKIKLTLRSIGFLETEVETWIALRVESRDAA